MLSRFLWSTLFIHNRDSGPSSELADSGRKIDMLVLHYESENAPPHAAPKTMESLTLGTHME